MTLTYSHRFHAGNVGDVWKHTAMLATIDHLRADRRRLWLIDTHAGEGVYRLGSTGEWSAGVARLFSTRDGAPLPLRRYLECQAAAAEPGPGRRYLGSPALIAGVMLPGDVVHLFEIVDETLAALRRNLQADPRVHIDAGDGPRLSQTLLAEIPAEDEVLVLIDPPWETKAEWTSMPSLLRDLHLARPAARLLLWYPIKSLTRPNAMCNRIRELGVPFLTMEVITTPVEMRRNRLNGSGMLWVNAPVGIATALAATTTFIGEGCASHDYWSTRTRASAAGA